MIKECTVTINNEIVTVVDYEGISVQFPAIKKDVKTVYVKNTNGKYKIVDKDEYENSLRETEKTEVVVEKKTTKKKTTNKSAHIIEGNQEDNENA
jgi:hypothetical protein